MLQPAVNIGVRAARSAARQLIRMLNRIENLTVIEKQRNDFVTEADTAAERAIIEEIHKVYPDHAILSEEAGQIGESSSRWIVDPLDGTKNFIHGIPHFAISIALEENGVIQHAIVYDPLREELFTASRGNGAFLNDTRIRASGRKSLDGAMLATGFPFRDKDVLPNYLKMFSALFERATDVRRAGSAALDLAYVAAGRIDAFWEMDLQPWDMAAGALLIREAGGMCTDFDGADGYLTSGNIIAGNLKLAGQIKKTIAPFKPG
ncbi:MAG: inositol monophosphatase family protein [Xanthomonadales bacterium]|nr:inositol monophosphatase family protein [Xanthomonadales bacterium]